jgi:SPP1 family predicted phage head-tail adaptor
MITAGDFNKRITLQKPSSSGVDQDGYPLPGTPLNLAVWAMVKPVSAREYTQAKADQTENIIRFVIRYRKNIDDTWLIFYKQRSFKIESVLNDNEENRTLTIIANEVV